MAKTLWIGGGEVFGGINVGLSVGSWKGASLRTHSLPNPIET